MVVSDRIWFEIEKNDSFWRFSWLIIEKYIGSIYTKIYLKKFIDEIFLSLPENFHSFNNYKNKA